MLSSLKKSNLPVNWHKQRPFNRHSVLLYDFISDHNLISANFKFKQKVNYTYFNSSARSYIDHIFVSENSHDKLVACTIIPFCEANLSDHLAMKLTIDLVIATPHMPENNCNTLRSCIPKIDLSKTVNRDKYLKHLKRISRNNSMSNIDIYSCTDTSTAQRLVNTLSDQVIQCINEACECVSRETKSTAKPPSKRKPWGANQQKWLKIENPCGTLFGLRVGSRVRDMYYLL